MVQAPGTNRNPAVDTAAKAKSTNTGVSPSDANDIRVAAGGVTATEVSSEATRLLGQDDNFINLTPLAGPASMAARREFNSIPLTQNGAYKAYKGLSADDLAGPDDIRLRQLNRAVAKDNVTVVRQLSDAADASGVEAKVYGRAKTPFSTFGKLREGGTPTIGDIKDLSGARIDIDPTQPGYKEFYRAQEAAQETIGDGLKLKQDYIAKPNRWGYTGRIHSTIKGADGLTHEVQVGSRDLSRFIDDKLVTKGGDKISLHDATGYKGKIHGVELPPHLEKQYAPLMKRITDANAAGKKVSDLPLLQRDIQQYRQAVQEALPPKLTQPPAPKLSAAARAGNVATKGFGVLGVVGGGLQVANGVNTLSNDGDKVEGVADIGAGTAGVVSGAAMVGGRLALGTSTGGAVAIIDGAKDIYTGVRDGDVEKAVVGGVKSGAGTAMMAGVATANPVLIAGGAIAYGGAVIYENREAIANGAKSAYNWVKSWF
ncbi:MAG: hypothetical protein AAFN74_03350 [Myxococcota bacterium]